MSLLNGLANMNLVQIIFLGAFASGIYFFTGFDNGDTFKKEIQQAEAKIQKADQNILSKEKELLRMKKFQKSVQEGGSRSLKVFLRYLPNSLTSTDMFSYLTTQAKDSGVRIESKQDNGIKSEKEKFYEVLQINIKLAGSFSQILHFLSGLTSINRILMTDNIKITSPKSQWQVLAEMDVYGYRYVDKSKEKKEEEDKKADKKSS